MEPNLLVQRIKLHALKLGFDACGITSPTLAQAELRRFLSWLEQGNHGELSYLARDPQARFDARSLLPNCRSVIVTATPYMHHSQEQRATTPPKIARYAQGGDYHKIVHVRLSQLATWLEAQAPGMSHRITVDTSPIAEKAAAVAAGIGWRGKHSLVLNEQLGSWFYIGLLLVSLELPCDHPIEERCRGCRRCLDACPSGALAAPYELDARRCISYLTTARKTAPIADSLHGWLYGCDECQIACPYNKFAFLEAGSNANSPFAATAAVRQLTWDSVKESDEPSWKVRFAGMELGRRPLEWIKSAIPETQN